MAAIKRTNADAFNDAEKYSRFLVKALPEIMLPGGMYRNVSDFADGSTLNIPTVGTVTLQEVEEGVPMDFKSIDSGNITLHITDYVGDAWSISDEVRQDNARIDLLEAARAEASTIAIAEWMETKFLAACNAVQADGNDNVINGQKHRFLGTGASNTISIDDFRRAKLAFDQARVPQAGRVVIVDPSVEFTLNGEVQVVTSDNPMFQGIITEGFQQNHKFVRNIFGFDIWTSSMLPKGAFSDGTGTVAGSGVANVFMNVLSDQHKPVMYAQRKAPSVSGWYDNEERADKYQTNFRCGFGGQRADTLLTVITNQDV